MILYLFLIFFVLGTIFGSFYYVVSYRIPKGESIVYPPSHCPNCSHRLGPIELIPIVSYLIQFRKCKNCKCRISIFYPLFEFVCGILFALSFISYGLSYELIIVLTFISMILIVSLSDYYYMVIPDSVLIFFSFSLLIEMFYIYGYEYVFIHLLYGIISFFIMYLLKLFGDFLFKKESMGGGDIKLMFLFGLMFGWDLSIFSIFVASIIGLPISLIMMKKDGSHVLPFGPYLGMAALIIVLFHVNINMVLNFIS